MPVCRECQREIPAVGQGKYCPYCGALLGEPEGLFEYRAGSSAAPDAAPAYYVHWEDRARWGFLRALSQTWSEVSFRPAQFFRHAPRTGRLGAALSFAFLLGMASTLFSTFWQYQLWGSFSGFAQLEEMLGMEFGRDFMAMMVLFSPVLVLFTIFFTAAVYHLCLLLVGGGRSGWEATFRAVCYSYGPQLFVLVPWCGGVIATVWQFVVMIIGWRELHNLTTGRAVLAAVLPLFLCCSLGLLFFYRLAGTMSRMGVQF